MNVYQLWLANNQVFNGMKIFLTIACLFLYLRLIHILFIHRQHRHGLHAIHCITQCTEPCRYMHMRISNEFHLYEREIICTLNEDNGPSLEYKTFKIWLNFGFNAEYVQSFENINCDI